MMQNRQPSGVPTGGQFAAHARGESGVSLAPASDRTDAPVQRLTSAQQRMLRVVSCYDEVIQYDTRNKREMKMLHVLAHRGLIDWRYDADEDWGERMYAWPVQEGDSGSDWREQPVLVEGRVFNLGDVHGGRLFHGSPHRMEEGAILEPGAAEANFSQSSATAVSITSLADRGLYWASQADGDEVYVYEVEPLGDVETHRASLANYGQNIHLYEARVPRARIVSVVPVEEARAYQGHLARAQRA